MKDLHQRICDKSDLELKKKIEQSLAWIWNETGYSTTKPENSQLAEINLDLIGSGSWAEAKDIPWIGSEKQRFEVIAFHYLRNKYRSQAIHDFMEKVESISSIIEQQQ